MFDKYTLNKIMKYYWMDRYNECVQRMKQIFSNEYIKKNFAKNEIRYTEYSNDLKNHMKHTTEEQQQIRQLRNNDAFTQCEYLKMRLNKMSIRDCKETHYDLMYFIKRDAMKI